jgi:carbamoyltransferase
LVTPAQLSLGHAPATALPAKDEMWSLASTAYWQCHRKHKAKDATAMSSHYFLGISEGSTDPAVALVRNGEIVAYAEEERFNRFKHAFGIYPEQALRYCLESAEITLADIDAVAIGVDLRAYSNGEMRRFFDQLNDRYDVDERTGAWQVTALNYNNRQAAEARHRARWRKMFGDIAFPPVVGMPHHYTHAFQAATQSPFSDSLCITLDGSGDQHCTVVWEHHGTELRPLHTITIPHSLGWLYSAFTEYLGFEAYDGEYKVMGLAAYGRHNEELIAKVGKIVHCNPDKPFSYVLDPTYIHYGDHTYSGRFTDKLASLFEQAPRLARDTISPWHEDLAYAVQYHLERSVTRLIRWAIDQTGISQITIGGGVGLNVKMNSAIFELPEVSDVWVNPLCGDYGIPIGAALLAEHTAYDVVPQMLAGLGIGYEETNEGIESTLQKAKVRYRKSSHLESEVAEALSQGKIVAWFQGRMEGGPRALGQRSILADPRNVAARDKVNAVIKFREYWRPFCPSMTLESAAQYFTHYTDAPFMVIAFKANHILQEKAPAIVHVDGTSRVQFVGSAILPRYHTLLKEFELLTGIPILLNTSFNVKGEPIVCTVKDALRTFWSTGLDILVAGDCIVTKRDCQ